jgi:hypothetical protein
MRAWECPHVENPERFFMPPAKDEFDLVDEMQWEDLVEFLTLEQAGLENSDSDTVPAALRAYFAEEGGYVEPESPADCSHDEELYEELDF